MVGLIGALLVILTLLLCYIVLLCFHTNSSAPSCSTSSDGFLVLRDSSQTPNQWPNDALSPVGGDCLDPWMAARSRFCGTSYHGPRTRERRQRAVPSIDGGLCSLGSPWHGCCDWSPQ